MFENFLYAVVSWYHHSFAFLEFTFTHFVDEMLMSCYIWSFSDILPSSFNNLATDMH